MLLHSYNSWTHTSTHTDTHTPTNTPTQLWYIIHLIIRCSRVQRETRDKDRLSKVCVEEVYAHPDRKCLAGSYWNFFLAAARLSTSMKRGYRKVWLPSIMLVSQSNIRVVHPEMRPVLPPNILSPLETFEYVVPSRTLTLLKSTGSLGWKTWNVAHKVAEATGNHAVQLEDVIGKYTVRF